MKRLIAICAAVFIILAVIGASAAALFVPEILRFQISAAFKGLGFQNIRIEAVRVAGDAVTFEDITLDADGFSGIDKISVNFKIADVVSTGKFNTLTLEGATLTALLNTDGSFALAGWSEPEFEPFEVPVKRILLNDVILDIDTLQGILRFETNGEAAVTRDGHVELQARTSGDQKQAQINTLWNGLFQTDGAWSLDAEILKGRIDYAGLTGARLGGWVSMGQESLDKPFVYGGQLTAGKLSFGPLPLLNVTAAIEGENDYYNIVLDALAAGTQGMSLHADFGQRETNFFGTANIRTLYPQDLPGFLTAAGLIEKAGQAVALSLVPPLKLDVTYLSDQSRHAMHHPLDIALSDNAENFRLEAAVETDLRKKFVRGSLSLEETPLQNLNALLPGQLLANLSFTDGTIALEGNFFSDLQIDTPVIEGPLSIKINGAGINADQVAVKGLSGELSFATLNPLATAEPQTLTYDGIESLIALTNGRARFSLTPEGQIKLHTFRGGFAGGAVSLAPVTYDPVQGAPDTVTLRISELDMAQLVELSQVEDLKVTGKLSGNATFSTDPDNFSVTDGRLENSGPGVIHYNPDDYPPFLEGQDQRMQIVRDAVTRFEYDELTLDFSGAVNGDMDARLHAKGFNRALFGDRPIHLNLNMEGAVPALFGQGTLTVTP